MSCASATAGRRGHERADHQAHAYARRKPGPQPPTPSRDQVFLTLYAAALTGLSAQFEMGGQPGHKPFHTEGAAELARAQVIARRAWNLARFATSLFEEDSQVRAFNELVE